MQIIPARRKKQMDSKVKGNGYAFRPFMEAVVEILQSRWSFVFQLGSSLVFLDAFIRWSYLNAGASPGVSPWSLETIADFTKIFIGCFIETIAFHSGIILVSYIVLKLLDFIKSFGRGQPSELSDIRREFRFSLIPLSLFYSSLTKLFLLFLLTVWRPSKTPPSIQNNVHPPSLQMLLWNDNLPSWNNSGILDTLSFLNDDQLDKEWIVRNVLGGMSAGFGLRVILDMHPAFTTIIILFGWIAKTAMAEFIGRWIASDEKTGEAWLAYSIP
ncbi:sterol homeostasis protein, variant 2 [Stygiomarasmius scandens]|uniref:Protein ARV n=1 Tax=Marasmiellus scandens TaxID=2682957 RepID=A0ABR1JHV9_9AGAR